MPSQKKKYIKARVYLEILCIWIYLKKNCDINLSFLYYLLGPVKVRIYSKTFSWGNFFFYILLEKNT